MSGAQISLRLPEDLLDALDAYRKRLPDQPGRPEAILRLLTGDLVVSDEAQCQMNPADSDLSDCMITSSSLVDAALAVRMGAAKVVTYDGETGEEIEEMFLVPIDWTMPPWKRPKSDPDFRPPPPRWEVAKFFLGVTIQRNAAAHPTSPDRWRYQAPGTDEWTEGLPPQADRRIVEEAFR